MVDTLALGASAARHGGSSPLPRTIFMTERFEISAEEMDMLVRAEKVELAATKLLLAVRRSIQRGTIPDRSEVDDAHLILRDTLNPDWPGNSDWWPDEPTF
jgi:hypothetical protein